MHFLVNNEKKVIFGWSAKCGCTHIKKIFYFLQNNDITHVIHTVKDRMKLPENINEYTTILFIRNPYKRIISGFLDKYKQNGQFRKSWKYDNITFNIFVHELIKNDWTMVERHHFTPQTSEEFNQLKLLESKIFIINDIENINYNYIENIFNKNIPTELLNFKNNRNKSNKDKEMNDYVYDLDMDIYFNYNVDIKYFYNEEIKNTVYNFYKNDFLFFENYGFNYKNFDFNCKNLIM